MEVGAGWRTIFENWPEAIPKSALLITSFGETIPFCDFLVSGSVLLVDREIPDSMGGRKVMVSYEAISAVKFTIPMELGRFQVMGFQPPM